MGNNFLVLIVNVTYIMYEDQRHPEITANCKATFDARCLLFVRKVGNETKNFPSTNTIDVVRLPYVSISSFNFAGMGAIASGWGVAADGVRFVSPTLREKMMTVMTDPLCNTLHFNQLPENMVCGFSVSSGTCKGDNGGPFTIFYNATEETILIGVASFVGADGCSDDLPSVFTRVQRYLPWISEVTGIKLE